MVTIPYYPLTDDMLKNIIRLQLGRIEKRVKQNQKIPFTYDDNLVDLIVSRCTERESGGRTVDAILTHTLLPTVSREYLNRLLEGRAISKVHVGVKDGDFTYAFD